MAKKKEKTLEEKLQEALVPENQWPYMLPENWCWVKLNKLYHVNPKNIVEDDSVDAAFIPMANIEPNFIGKYKFEVDSWNKVRKGHTQFADGDVTFAKISPCFENGKAFIAENLPNGIGAGTTELIVLRNRKIVPKYTFYLISTEKFVNGGRRTYSGVVGQQRISMDYVNQFPIPLPPLPEQKRIVHRIESLFAKLDEAKEKIQQVLDGAEMRKAAILHKAFTGELTKTWRKENGISDDTWGEYTLQSVCTMKITDGTHKTPTYSDKENGVVFLSAKDITSGEINWENTKYITSELHTELYSRLAPQINDILLAKNGTTGVAALVKEDKVFDIYVTLALLRPNVEIVIPEYLLNIINSPICKVQFNENLTGIGVPNLHLRDIKDVKVKVPSIGEQKIISDKVEMLLANEGMVTKNCLKQIEVIDTMKKSILAKAFRGELGTNNPTEDSALNLLKEVLQDKF